MDPTAIRFFLNMPYEISFNKTLPILDRNSYINDCCVGGDVVMERLLPSVRLRYSHIQANSEDWGWFIWFRAGAVSLAIDIYTDDAESGEFRIHLTSQRKRWGLFSTTVDSPELEDVRQMVEEQLQGWTDAPCRVERIEEG